jgi:hypothetical protein
MFNQKAINTIYNIYGKSNIRQCEEYVNISRPDKSSDVYKEFEFQINNKVNRAMTWLSNRNIEYVWNYRVDSHLYRLYLPCKDLLLDFEYYPVVNPNYNYIRITFKDDIINVLISIFPEHIFDTKEMTVWKLTQKASNRFLKDNNKSPIYDEKALRLALVKDDIIYQSIILKNQNIVSNVTKSNCQVAYGSLILFRYLNEVFEIPEFYIKTNLDNSYINTLYQLLNLPITTKSAKKKIWWSSKQTKWHIAQNKIHNYMPFYFTETIKYCYSK